jgi:hypothetical protein
VGASTREWLGIVATEYVTADGVMTHPGGVGEIEHGGWSNADFNDELAESLSDQPFASDALLLSRVIEHIEHPAGHLDTSEQPSRLADLIAALGSAERPQRRREGGRR